MSRERLPQAIEFVAGPLVEQLTGKSVGELANAEVKVGNYRAAGGRAVESRWGRSLALEFELAVSPTAMAFANDTIQVGSLDVPDNAGAEELIWMRHRADPLADDEATLAQAFADIGTHTEGNEGINGDAAAWATAVHAARNEITPSLESIDGVPAAFADLVDSASALVSTLHHFCTYDEERTHYPRWQGTGDSRTLSDRYVELNLVEEKLHRDRLYAYFLLPAASLTGSTGTGEDAYREIVMRLDPTGDADEPFATQTVYSVAASRTANFHDIVVFHAEEGLGIPIPQAARAALGTEVRAFLSTMPSDADARPAFFEAYAQPPQSAGTNVLELDAVIHGNPTFPEGVQSASDDPVRTLYVPIDKVQEVAALPEVLALDIARQEHLLMDDARNDISHADFITAVNALDASSVDGAGVVIGIIDSGIDGTHPAFAGRILSVWDQTGPSGTLASPAANSPTANHTGNAAYAGMVYGTELTGAAVSGSTDQIAHGTHVAGIATGAEVLVGTNVECDRGIAPQANIVVVKGTLRQSHTRDAIRYIFQRASEQGADGVPCVINMSFGGHFNPHDGTDLQSLAMMNLVTDSDGDPLPGRILVAAAGNERNDDAHVRREMGFGEHLMTVRVNGNVGTPGTAHNLNRVVCWARQPGDRDNPVPLRIRVLRNGNAAHSTASVAQGGNVSPIFNYGGGVRVQVEVDFNDPSALNGDTEISISWKRVNAAGNHVAQPLPVENWTIEVLNFGLWETDVDFHAWTISQRAMFLNRVTDPNVLLDDDLYLVGTPAAAEAVISVASSNSKLNWQTTLAAPNDVANFGQTHLHDISNYSSTGPLRESSENVFDVFGLTINLSAPAVDVTAPGSAIAAARSTQRVLTGNHQLRTIPQGRPQAVMKQGTSMASPVVTGIVASLLAVEPTLTFRQLRERMRTQLTVPSTSRFGTLPAGHNAWGWGLVNGSQLLP